MLIYTLYHRNHDRRLSPREDRLLLYEKKRLSLFLIDRWQASLDEERRVFLFSLYIGNRLLLYAKERVCLFFIKAGLLVDDEENVSLFCIGTTSVGRGQRECLSTIDRRLIPSL